MLDRRPSSSQWGRGATAFVVVAALFASGWSGVASADAVGDQQHKVQRIADQLDGLRNRIDQLDADFNAAQDTKSTLDSQIVDSRSKIAEQQTQLDAIETTLGTIAIDNYVSGSPPMSPLLSSPGAYADAQQRTELTRLSIDNGAEDIDRVHALTTNLAKTKLTLERQQQQATVLANGLDQKRQQATTLTTDYQAKYSSAKAELGDLIQREQDRRAAAAAADAAAKQQAATDAAAAAAKRATAEQQAKMTGNLAKAPTSATPPSVATTAPTTTIPAAGPPARGGGSETPAPAAVSPPPVLSAASAPPNTTTIADPTAAATPPAPSARGEIVVAAAMSQLGVPYVFAAESPGVAFDCSGLTRWAWARVGVSLPHFAATQYSTMPHVTRDQIQPGDLIFYDQPIGHVSIYIGNGQYVHAPQTGDVVRTGTVNWATVVGISRPG